VDVKDIDFDELDRAVNSAISKNNSADSENPTAASVLPNEPTISVPAPQPISTAPVMPNRQSISRPATGRFMDMVHSSNNMRVSVPERPALRPLSSSFTASQMTVQAPASPVIRPMQPQVNATVKTDNSDVDIDRISDEIDKTLNVNTGDVQESPFLPGAKVEKRPLNAFSFQSNSSQETPAEPIKVSPVDDMLGDQDKVETPLPAELQSDLLTIEASEVAKTDEMSIPDDLEEESDESIEPQDTTDEPVANNQYLSTEEDDAPVFDEIKKDTVSDSNLKSTVSSDLQNPIAPVAATSIPKQYTELPNTEEKEIGSIYDTNSYHKAMAPLPKKKSGWMWVIWIALLMIVSVGAGIAVYFFVLPQL
jgi:hypothetical protein